MAQGARADPHPPSGRQFKAAAVELLLQLAVLGHMTMTQPLTDSLQVRWSNGSSPTNMDRPVSSLLPHFYVGLVHNTQISINVRTVARCSSQPQAFGAGWPPPPTPQPKWGLNEVKVLLHLSTHPHPPSAPPQNPMHAAAC